MSPENFDFFWLCIRWTAKQSWNVKQAFIGVQGINFPNISSFLIIKIWLGMVLAARALKKIATKKCVAN